MIGLIARWLVRPPGAGLFPPALVLACLQPAAGGGRVDPRGDAELAAAAVSGDRQALEVLVERHYDAIYRLAYKWCGLRDEAQDVAQEACVKLVGKLHTFRGKSAFKSWLYRLVLNTAKDTVRRSTTRWKHVARFEVEHLPAGSRSGAEPALAAAGIMAAIDQLPVKQKQAALLVWAEGFSHKEAAGVMGCRESTVSWHLHKARKTLKPKLEQIP